jgi:hypothetical protein
MDSEHLLEDDNVKHTSFWQIYQVIGQLMGHLHNPTDTSEFVESDTSAQIHKYICICQTVHISRP